MASTVGSSIKEFLMNTSSETGSRLALILGATGGSGAAVADALHAHGWSIRAMTRDPEAAARNSRSRAPVEWLRGDAMNAADTLAAASGVSLIFHGVNPPKYQKWRELAIPMLANAIAAAQAVGARIVFPGNIYNFGLDAWPVITETSPQHPVSSKGAVRVEMEAMLAASARQGGRALILRAGDFFGPQTRDAWLSAVILKGGAEAKTIVYPGEPTAGHAWAFLPDFAEAVARLAEMEQSLSDFEVFNFSGHWIDPGIDLAHALRRVLGRPELPVKRFPWWQVYLGAPFVPFLREVQEMRYLWREPVRLDGSRLAETLGKEPHTPLDEALRLTLNCRAR
jgi:nucleoside-diphosphate-sugar epimerase